MPQLTLEVNGRAVATDVAPTTLLMDLLRETLRLTGTHSGCDTAQCGACTVLVDGGPVKSCSVLALQMQGRHVTTVEGLPALAAGAARDAGRNTGTGPDGGTQTTATHPTGIAAVAAGELAAGGESTALHPLQTAFMDCHGLQCGFCTPGMLMAAAGLLAVNPDPSDAEIVHALEGNLCRCTGYVNIVAAVRQAASAMRASREGAPA
jgi:carbon-monoxide dehydrogenase small subunit